MRASWRPEPYLHLYTLCALTVAHPLLALLARYPEFFTARGWDARDTWQLAGILVFALPFAPALVRAALARRNRLAAAVFVTFVVASTSCVWLLQLFQGWRSDHLAMALALAGGGLAAWSYRRFANVRTFLTFLSPALLAIPLAFVLDPRIARLGEESPLEFDGLEIDAKAPIFFVVFDAFSATAVMDEEQLVNPRRYPHLAALAGDGVWFPNASGIARWTLEAIPAMLTGEYPHPDKLARLADHPRNLFTLLGDAYRIVAAEAAMELCPPQLNAYPRPAPPSGIPALATDLGLIWLHRTLPTRYARRFPRVDQAWGNFVDPQARVGGQIGRFYDFLETFQADAPPTLYYLHVVFPHMPYQYLPSGKIFRAQVSKFLKPALPGERSIDDETRIFLYKRYLLQTGLVDRMVGDLKARLEELGLYDRSTVILTADHGGRIAATDHFDDIFLVPLIIKPPHTTAGSVDRRPVSTLDLLPSLLDLLDAPPMPSPGGRKRSFFAEDYELASQLYDNGELRPMDLGLHQSKLDLVSWKLDRFGDGEEPLALYRAGSTRPELLGEPLENLDVHDDPRVVAELDLGSLTVTYDPDSSYAPVLLNGSVSLEGYDGPCCELAITVNGQVEATVNARSYEPPDQYRFRCTIAESLWRPGPNDVRVWMIDPQEPRRLFGPRQIAPKP